MTYKQLCSDIIKSKGLYSTTHIAHVLVTQPPNYKELELFKKAFYQSYYANSIFGPSLSHFYDSMKALERAVNYTLTVEHCPADREKWDYMYSRVFQEIPIGDRH